MQRRRSKKRSWEALGPLLGPPGRPVGLSSALPGALWVPPGSLFGDQNPLQTGTAQGYRRPFSPKSLPRGPPDPPGTLFGASRDTFWTNFAQFSTLFARISTLWGSKNGDFSRFCAIGRKVQNVKIPKNDRICPVVMGKIVDSRRFAFVSVSDPPGSCLPTYLPNLT